MAKSQCFPYSDGDAGVEISGNGNFSLDDLWSVVEDVVFVAAITDVISDGVEAHVGHPDGLRGRVQKEFPS